MAVANVLLALCVTLAAVSTPSSGYAVSLSPHRQRWPWAVIQQTYTTDEIMSALEVSINGCDLSQSMLRISL